MIEIFPCLWVFKNSFDSPAYVYQFIEDLIDSNPEFNWEWAQTSASAEQNNNADVRNMYRSNKVFAISAHKHNEQIAGLDSKIFNQLTNFIADYATNYDLGAVDDEGYILLKYEEGTMYKQHYDCGPKSCHRVFSIICYLNDDYVGGELEFPYLGVTYKPAAGDILIFPSNYTFSHIAHPVTLGTKYSLVSWAEFSRQHNV